jgi:hypothetical protein
LRLHRGEPDLEAADVETDVVRLVGVWLDAEDGDLDGLRGVEVADGVDDVRNSVDALVTYGAGQV